MKRICLLSALAAGLFALGGCMTPPAFDRDAQAAVPQASIAGKYASNGAVLQYRDYGGRGPAVILLAGTGDTAHIYADFAPLLTDRYRVYALTRRGHGGSERTADGYAVPALASDVLAFMDQRGIERAALIGHSMAGDEITAFAARWPQRVTRLVYLDAALDHSDMEQAYAGDPVEAPPPTPEDFATRDSLLAWYKRQFAFWSPAQQANFEAGGADRRRHLAHRPALGCRHGAQSGPRRLYARVRASPHPCARDICRSHAAPRPAGERVAGVGTGCASLCRPHLAPVCRARDRSLRGGRRLQPGGAHPRR